MDIEEVQSHCGRRVSVWEEGRLIAEGLLSAANVVSVPVPQADGEGWRMEQVLVLEIDGEVHRVSLDAWVAPKT